MADQEGVIFEIIRQGSYAKVTAVCTRTAIEATVIGPSKGADEALKRMAWVKLRRMIGRAR
jgi:hypothetical protein